MPAGGDMTAAGIGAASNILGAYLAQAPETSADDRIPFATPQANFSLQSALVDQGGMFGFADFSMLSQAGPMQRLISQINALPIVEKQKRRAITALRAMRLESEGISQEGTPGVSGSRIRALEGVLGSLGMTIGDIDDLREKQVKYDEQLAQFDDIGPFQQDIIRNRLSAASGVAEAAAGFATGRSSGLQDTFREQILRDQNKNIDDQEEAMLLQAQFGGFNPGTGLEAIQRARTNLPIDAELDAIQRAFAVVGGVNSLLNPGSAAALSAGQLSIGADQGALGIASQQSMAANQLQSTLLANNAMIMGSGVQAAGLGFASAVQKSSDRGSDLLGAYMGGVGGFSPAG